MNFTGLYYGRCVARRHWLISLQKIMYHYIDYELINLYPIVSPT